MEVIDKAVKHYESSRKSIHIPEWDAEIFFFPPTVSEIKKISQISDSGYEETVNLVIEKSLDKEGKRVFNRGDKLRLTDSVPIKILARLASAIRGEKQEQEQEREQAESEEEDEATKKA